MEGRSERATIINSSHSYHGDLYGIRDRRQQIEKVVRPCSCPASDRSWTGAPNIKANEPFAMRQLTATM